jgi:hypothetical protein
MNKDYIDKLNNVLNVSRREYTTRDLIVEESEAVTKLLILKNEAYGDSALNPANIFARGDAVENLSARIDDKLMRIKMRGIDDNTEDTVQDLIGYLILLKVALRQRE